MNIYIHILIYIYVYILIMLGGSPDLVSGSKIPVTFVGSVGLIHQHHWDWRHCAAYDSWVVLVLRLLRCCR